MYSQNDPQWDDEIVGFGKKNIGQIGCLLTCYAQLLTNHGRRCTPDQLDEIFTKKKVYFNTNELPDDALKLWPDVIPLKAIWTPGLDDLKREPGEEIIIRLRNPKHFAIFKYRDKDKVIIADPRHGDTVNFADRYGNPRWNMSRLIRYRFEDELINSVAILQQKGIIASPDYWMANARPGKTVSGENARSLIIKMAEGVKQ